MGKQELANEKTHPIFSKVPYKTQQLVPSTFHNTKVTNVGNYLGLFLGGTSGSCFTFGYVSSILWSESTTGNIGYVMKDTSREPMLGTHLNNYQGVFRIHNCASQENWRTVSNI